MQMGLFMQHAGANFRPLRPCPSAASCGAEAAPGVDAPSLFIIHERLFYGILRFFWRRRRLSAATAPLRGGGAALIKVCPF